MAARARAALATAAPGARRGRGMSATGRTATATGGQRRRTRPEEIAIVIVSAGMAMNADPGADTEYAASDPSVADHAAFQGRAQFDAVSVRPSVHDVASCFSKADWDGGGRIYSAPLPRPIRYGEGAFLLVDVILFVLRRVPGFRVLGSMEPRSPNLSPFRGRCRAFEWSALSALAPECRIRSPPCNCTSRVGI